MDVTVDSFEYFIKDVSWMFKGIVEIIAILGILYIGKFSITTICDIVIGLRAHVYSKLWKKNYIQRYGKWAVITGCTDGIGKAYSEELAKEGLNIILISRKIEKLNKVSSDLVQRYNIETEIVQVDFSDGKSIYEKINEHLHNKDIGILVNNVGVMHEHPKYFVEVTDNEIWSNINVNIASVPAMTKLVLPFMVRKGKGAIINIGSITGNLPMPLVGIYSASKVFVDYFSQALNYEYKCKGITVQTVIPSTIATNMTSFSPWIGSANIITPSASIFASHALSTLGYTSRTTGYWVHGIQSWLVEKVASKWAFMTLMYLLQKFLISDMKKIS